MHAGTGQHRADREIPVNGVQVQLVANPTFLVPFAVALATHVTTGGQVSQVLGQRARRLEFQAFGRRGGRTSPCLGRPRLRGAAGAAGAGLATGRSGASMAVASRLTCPTSFGSAWVFTMCS